MLSRRYPSLGLLAWLLVLTPLSADGLCMNRSKNGAVVTLTEPYGYFWTNDNVEEYSTNSNCTVLIAPVVDGSDATFINIDYYVETEACCDGAVTYQGDIIDEDNLLAYHNGTLDSTVIVPGPTAFFNFISDGTINRAGILGFYRAVAEEDVDWENLACPFDCHGRGTCLHGRCQCDPGYLGALCQDDDNFRLRELYENCQGSQWTANWDPLRTTTVCSTHDHSDYFVDSEWDGVVCASGRVAKVDLRGRGLDCTGHGLPAHLPLFLETVDLSNEIVTGTIPLTWFQSSYRVEMRLSGTGLVGEIPGTVSSATALSILDLSNNQLSGQLPETLTRLSSLRELDLSGNQLIGFVSDEFAYLPNALLTLSGNKFLCPIPLIEQIDSGHEDCIKMQANSVSPSYALNSGGDVITITGLHFRPEYRITCVFGGIESLYTVLLDDTHMYCAVPPLKVGQHALELWAFGKRAVVATSSFELLNDCPVGTYISSTNKAICLRCPDGAICPGGQQKPYPQDGYHQALRASDKFLKCFVPSACPSMPSGECAAGFTGSRCSECSPGLYKKGTECTTCTGTSLMLPVLAAVLGTLAVCGVGIWMAIADLNYCTVNVAVQFFQVAGLILSIDMGWPDLLRPITHTVKSFNVDLVALNFNCAFQIDFNDWMTIALFVPAVFAVVILTTCLAWALVFHGKSAIAKALWTSYKAFLAVCLIGHIPLSKQFVTVFECATDVDRSYMISDPQVSCYTSQWYGGKSKAIAGCVLFACGIPFWVLVISLRNRKKLDDPAVVHRYGILFDLYVDGCWYFTFYRTINHLLLMAVPVLFADWPIVIFLFALFLVNVDRVLVERRNPYRFPHCNNIHSHTAWAFTFLIIAGIAFYSRLLSEIHQNVLGGIVFAFMVAVTLLLAHAFLYEAQLMYYPWLRTFGLTGRIARSRAYKALFPRHLTSIGQAEVRQCKRLPALHSKPKAEYYPQGAFESPEDHLNKKTNGVRGPNTGELEIVRSSYVLEAKGSMFKGDGEAD